MVGEGARIFLRSELLELRGEWEEGECEIVVKGEESLQCGGEEHRLWEKGVFVKGEEWVVQRPIWNEDVGVTGRERGEGLNAADGSTGCCFVPVCVGFISF